MIAGLPKLRGRVSLGLRRPGLGTTARSSAVSDRCAPGRTTSEARPLRFAAVPGTMKSNKRWTEQ